MLLSIPLKYYCMPTKKNSDTAAGQHSYLRLFPNTNFIFIEKVETAAHMIKIFR